MGNRAVITTKEQWDNKGFGLYLHWNGGRDSVEAFLKYCELKNYANNDFARLSQVVGNFFGGNNTIEIGMLEHLNCGNMDNGTYIIDNWQIVDRKYTDGREQYNYDLHEMLEEIDNSMPEEERIIDFINAEPIKIEDIKLGDIITFINYDGHIHKYEVIDFGKDIICNGTNVKGLPRIKYCNDDETNINNYIYEGKAAEIRIINNDKEIDLEER